MSEISELISATHLLSLLKSGLSKTRILDVRSPLEFAEGAIPGSLNLPILTNSERHEVGLCYKQHGSTAAAALGHALVAGDRERRVKAWRNYLESADVKVVACWRGGLRSKVAVEWLKETGLCPLRVQGGYKAIRQGLLNVFQSLPSLWVLSGPTGSGKTELLEVIRAPALNLEKLANHRGSAFGADFKSDQPAQATFENALALKCLLEARSPILLEDESPMIGKVHLPSPLTAQMKTSPVIRIQRDVRERAQRLMQEYVRLPMEEGFESSFLLARHERSLLNLRNKLGGSFTEQILKDMRQAFHTQCLDQHEKWIESLLVHYYDKRYEHSFQRSPRKILFEGDWHSCKAWIQQQFV